jgi:hypothetical protein
LFVDLALRKGTEPDWLCGNFRGDRGGRVIKRARPDIAL